MVRQVLELKQKLSSVEGKSVEQMVLLADLEQKLAARNKMLFGRTSEKGKQEKRPARGPSQ